jgi:hypothetical protein
MPSTYTTSNGIEKPATGEQNNTWGGTANLDFDLIDQSLDGYVSIALAGTTSSLAITDGALSDGRNRVITFTGALAASHTVTITPNDAEKWYVFQNSTTGGYAVIIAQGGGSGTTVSVEAGYSKMVRVDGTGSNSNAVEMMASPSFSGTVKAPTAVLPTNTPGADYRISQNGVIAVRSVETGALVNTIYASTGFLLNGYTVPYFTSGGTRCVGVIGTSSYGVLELGHGGADADGTALGVIGFVDPSSTVGVKQAVSITGYSQGSTALDRGAQIKIFTKTNAGGLTQAMAIDNVQNVGIGSSNAHAKVALDVISTTKAFRPSCMTTVQRDAISGPATGSMVYNTSTNKLNVYTGATWEVVTSA